MGINNVALAAPGAPVNGTTPVNGIKGPRRLPVLPHPPRIGGPSLLSVNQTALVHSGVNAQGSFVFRKDSAGLGIPRDELGNLRGFSRHAVQKGVATTPIYVSAAPGPSNGIRGVRNAPAPIAIHRGYAPSYGGFSGAHSGNLSSNPGSPGSISAPMRSAPSMSSAPAASAPPAPSGGSGRH